MTKRSITGTWIAGLIVLVIGLVVSGISVGMMLANGGTYTQLPNGGGYNFEPTINAYFWTTVSFIVVGGIIALVGGVMQMAAWIGALVNTYRLQDKAWFIVLLVGGVLSLVIGLSGFAVMVAYLIAGPDVPAMPQPTAPLVAPRPPEYAVPR
jgi:hypothetical protein